MTFRSACQHRGIGFFYQGIKGLDDWSGPHRIGSASANLTDHLMASSAIPVVFPAVKIGKQYFGDGAVRQLAPTSPALHLGARRILAIGVSGNRTKAPLEDSQPEQPNLMQILGHILGQRLWQTPWKTTWSLSVTIRTRCCHMFRNGSGGNS